MAKANIDVPSIESLFTLVPCDLPEIAPIRYEQKRKYEDSSDICFSNGIARGPEAELRKVMEAYQQDTPIPVQTKIPGIFELSMKDYFNYGDGNAYLYDVIKKFPELKITGFIEDWSCGEVYVAFSESGYEYVTEQKFAGKFDTKADWNWQWEYGPTDTINDRSPDIRTGIMNNINYSFPFRKQWESNNYVVKKAGKNYLLKAKAGMPQKVALPFDSKELWRLNTQGVTNIRDAYIAEYLGDEVHVRFPEKVGDRTIIGISQRAVQTPENYRKIESIQLPDSYLRIGANAFKGCESLTEVVLPKSLAEIGKEAFADCKALESVVFSGDVSMQNYEFIKSCNRAKEKQPLADGIFKNCTALKKVWLMGCGTNVSQNSTFPGCDQYVVFAPSEATYVKEHNPGHYQEIGWAEAETMLEWTMGSKTVEIRMEAEDLFNCLPAAGDILLLNHPNAVVGKNMFDKCPHLIPQILRGLPLKLEVVQVTPNYSSWNVVLSASQASENERESCVIPKMQFCSPKDSPIKGKIFALDNETCAIQLEKLITERGGNVKQSVTLDTDYLIINPELTDSTAKRRRADEIRAKGKSKVKNITYQKFYEMISVPISRNYSSANKASREVGAIAKTDQKAQDAAKKTTTRRNQKADEIQKAEAEAKARLKEELRKYNETHKKWESECAEINARRSAFVSAKVSEEKASIVGAATKKRDGAIAKANAIIKEQTDRKALAESTLASLGMFKFGEKKTQKAIIEEAEKLLTDAHASISAAESIYLAEISEAEKKARSMSLSFQIMAEIEFPLPVEPVKPN